MSKRPWLTFELKHLLTDYSTISNLNVLATRIGRTREEIREKAEALGLTREVKNPGPCSGKRPAMRKRPVLHTIPASEVDAPRPTRRDGEALTTEWRDKDLTRESATTLESIIWTLSRLKKEDVGLWEELILEQATTALQSLQKEKAA